MTRARCESKRARSSARVGAASDPWREQPPYFSGVLRSRRFPSNAWFYLWNRELVSIEINPKGKERVWVERLAGEVWLTGSLCTLIVFLLAYIFLLSRSGSVACVWLIVHKVLHSTSQSRGRSANLGRKYILLGQKNKLFSRHCKRYIRPVGNTKKKKRLKISKRHLW